MTPLIFSHIPKTAGTSFRVALTKQLGNKKVLNDYGQNEPTTSAVVRQATYLDDDVYGLIDSQPSAIIGHFPVGKYLNLSCYDKVISFVREPVERVISEYKHHVRHAGYTGTLMEFAKLPQNKNKMHRYFRGLPWAAFGFVGVAERYNESLALLNRKFNLNIGSGLLNTSPSSQSINIQANQLASLKRLNHLDYRLYNAALNSFDWRVKLGDRGQPFVHGAWTINRKDGVISGFAFFENSNLPVELTFTFSANKMVNVLANRFHADIHKHQGARNGYVGFTLDMPDGEESDPQCCVALTQQALYLV